MNHLFKIVLIIIFFIILTHNITNIEPFNKKNHIILMGDSMFANNNYVKKNQSIIEHLKKKHYNTIIVAKDEATINNLLTQFENIPNTIKNNSDNLLFISIGGNDLLNYYVYNNKNIDVNNLNIVDTIFEKYKKTINTIISKTNMKITLLNLYYPPDTKKLFHIINKWNKLLKQYTDQKNIRMLKVNSILYRKKHFVHSIEPSNKGGKILSYTIFKKAYNS